VVTSRSTYYDKEKYRRETEEEAKKIKDIRGFFSPMIAKETISNDDILRIQSDEEIESDKENDGRWASLMGAIDEPVENEFPELEEVRNGGEYRHVAQSTLTENHFLLDEAILQLSSYEGRLTKNSALNKKIEKSLEEYSNFWYRTANLCILRFLQLLRYL